MSREESHNQIPRWAQALVHVEHALEAIVRLCILVCVGVYALIEFAVEQTRGTQQ